MSNGVSIVSSKTQQVLDELRDYESPNVLYIAPDGSWPIVWERAKGMYVWDVEGKKYLDLTAAFGVAAAGHCNPRVVAAGKRQMGRLLHAMGDVHPHVLKAELARKLSEITFERWSANVKKHLSGKTIFCNSGFESVEAALKTALLATGRSGVIAFKDAYHGLGYGALNTTYRQIFRDPFQSQLARFGSFIPFPKTSGELEQIERQLRDLLEKNSFGAVLVEPVQGRGGINVPPLEFLPMLRRLCDQFEALLILDEVYTGFGRTGRWFSCEYSGTIPDLICLGKALTGGFPLSACVGRAEVIDRAWPRSTGEAIHTSTFLGHPVGCAMALAELKEISDSKLVERSAEMGLVLVNELKSQIAPSSEFEVEVRGQGLMVGLELRLKNGQPASEFCLKIVNQMLQKGFILLPDGEAGNVISFTPPLTITRRQIRETVLALADIITKK